MTEAKINNLANKLSGVQIEIRALKEVESKLKELKDLKRWKDEISSARTQDFEFDAFTMSLEGGEIVAPPVYMQFDMLNDDEKEKLISFLEDLLESRVKDLTRELDLDN